jgi:glycosyltransferase involved in cell wall biosynthesis
MSTSVGALLVDARPVDHPTARQRGIGRYVTGLLRGLTEIGAPVVGLYATDVESEVLSEAIPALPLRRWSPDVVREHAVPGTWYLATQLMLHPIPLDPVPSIITQARLPVAAVMYDVIPYRFPDQYQVEPSARRQAQLRAPLARTLDALLAISHFAANTAAEELAFPARRVRTIGAGVEPQFVSATADKRPFPERVLPAGLSGYVVAVTGGDERKNTEGLLRAWGLVDPNLRSQSQLVIATAHSPTVLRRWEQWAREADVQDDVIFTGSVTDDEMVAILQRASLAVMPSVEEGFGLPVVEAAACGCPVICSNVTSLPEVLEEPAALFDPYYPAAIARAIERGLTDDDHRQVLIEAGKRAASRWTWPRVAKDTMAALEELGPRWTQELRSPGRRIAVAGPFAGSESGIASYDESLLGALHRAEGGPDVDVFIDASASPEPTHGEPERFPVRALGRYQKPWNYDHIIAVLGSSHHHVATADLAMKTPCHVWLHEPSLVGVHVGLAHASGSETWATEYVQGILHSTESDELVAEITDPLDAMELDEAGVTMLATTLANARSVVVSSERAAEVVRRVCPDGPPLLVLPLAYPPVHPAAEAPHSAEIVAVGWLAANKVPLLAVDLLAHLVRSGAEVDVRLTFVGASVGDVADEVQLAADRAGVGDRVIFTGRLNDEAYHERLRNARAGLQLRASERGEMSAAVADLVSHGVPTVTTMSAAGPPSPGVRIVRLGVAELAEELIPLLTDDVAWLDASTDALDRAGRWTFDDVARALLEWLDKVDQLEPTAIHRR